MCVTMIGKLVLGKVLKPVLRLSSDAIGRLSILYDKVGADPACSEHVKSKTSISVVKKSLSSPQVKVVSVSEHVMTKFPCDQRSSHQSLFVTKVLLVVSAVLALISGAPSVNASTSSSDEEEDDENDANTKGRKYLWYSGDSYGYTRGIPRHI